MTYKIAVRFDLPTEQDYVWSSRVHRILNFSEDLFRQFRDGDLASHEIQDHATSTLIVDVRSKAKVRRVAATIENMLDADFPDGIASVEIIRT